MCSCSGSCNCNSTTIPKGPAGPIGPQGIQGVAGFTGSNGNDGNDGLNSFTTLVNLFYQPTNYNGLANSFVTIDVVDSTWAAINQIIYISYDANNIGGYYRVISKPTSVTLYITRLDWTIPGIIFVGSGGTVLNSSSVIPAGTKGIDGTNGTGTPGTNGFNAFSPLPGGFTQPVINTPYTINNVVNTAWIGLGQIVFISSLTTVGGFYQVNSKTGTTVTVIRLDWTIPNVTFIAPGAAVPNTSYMIPSGAKGADGIPSPAIIDSFWGEAYGIGRINSLKTSIGVAPLFMDTNDDALDIQAIFVVDPNVTIDPCAFYLRISNVDSSTTPLSDIIAQYTPTSGLITTTPSQLAVIHVNCKLQRLGANRMAVKSEWYVSKGGDSIPFYSNNIVEVSMNSLTSGVYTMSNGNTFNNTQYIMAAADDDVVLSIYARHLEVRSIKKY